MWDTWEFFQGPSRLTFEGLVEAAVEDSESFFGNERPKILSLRDARETLSIDLSVKRACLRRKSSRIGEFSEVSPLDRAC